MALFRPQDDETAHDKGRGHDLGCEQVRLDGCAEQQAQHHGREEGNQHIQRKPLRLPLRGQRCQRIPDLLPVDDDDRQDGAGLDRDVEYFALGIVQAQQGARQNQVTGT